MARQTAADEIAEEIETAVETTGSATLKRTGLADLTVEDVDEVVVDDHGNLEVAGQTVHPSGVEVEAGDDDPVLATDRFPTDDVEIEEGSYVWIDAGAVRSYSDVGTGSRQGCDVIGVADDGVIVEYPSHGETERAAVSYDHVVETDLEEGERVRISYDSVYSSKPVTEKEAEVVAVKRTRRGGFDGITVETDDEKLYRVSCAGGISTTGSTHGSTHRRIGDDAIVERIETDDEEEDVETDGGRDELTVEGYDDVDSIVAICGRHGRRTRDGMDMPEHAEQLFVLARRATQALGDALGPDAEIGRDDVSITFEGDDLELLYEALEYAVEDPDGTVDAGFEHDLAVARRLYVQLGGEITFEPRPIEGEIVATDGGSDDLDRDGRDAEIVDDDPVARDDETATYVTDDDAVVICDGGERVIDVGERVLITDGAQSGEIGTIVSFNTDGSGRDVDVELETGATVHTVREKVLTLDDAVGKLEALVEDLERWGERDERRAEKSVLEESKVRCRARAAARFDDAGELEDRLGLDG